MRRLYFRIPKTSGVLARAFISTLALAVISSGLGLAQTTLTNRNPESSRSAPTLRAEQGAEQKVSLSADKIVEILRNEPGLLLEVKRLLVKKAYEQGRILDAADLTDEALFRLLREEENTRVLATREIEDRGYIRAKPSREKIEREQELARERENYVIPNPASQAEQPYPPHPPSRSVPAPWKPVSPDSVRGQNCRRTENNLMAWTMPAGWLDSTRKSLICRPYGLFRRRGKKAAAATGKAAIPPHGGNLP